MNAIYTVHRTDPRKCPEAVRDGHHHVDARWGPDRSSGPAPGDDRPAPGRRALRATPAVVDQDVVGVHLERGADIASVNVTGLGWASVGRVASDPTISRRVGWLHTQIAPARRSRRGDSWLAR